MSKYVKGLLTEHVRQQLTGVDNALLVRMIGVSANMNGQIRSELVTRGVHVLYVKNSMARRACEGTGLEGLFDNLSGPVAVCWGAEDVVSLAKEVVGLAQDKRFAPDKKKAAPGTGFLIAGGIMNGQPMSAEMVAEVSKWASREETISMVIGQAVGAGANLIAGILGAGGTLVGQIRSKGEGDSDETDASAEVPAVETAG